MKLNIFRTTIKEGNFSKNRKFYPNLNTKEIELLHDSKIKKFIETTNLNIDNYLVLENNNKKLNKQTINKDTKKVKEQIIVLKSENVALLVETVDDPIIVVSANNVSVIGIGTIENLDNNILHEMIEILIKETDVATFEMTFYIGACPNKENYEIKNINLLKNNNVWKDSYEKLNNKYYLDIRYAIYNTLLYEIVDPHNIYFDSKDPVDNKNYYSKIGQREGTNLTCVVYQNEKEI